MPIYEFECANCGQQTEILMAAHEMDLVVCGYCGSRELKRVLSTHAALNRSGKYPENAADRCCGIDGPTTPCAGPGSCCGRTGH